MMRLPMDLQQVICEMAIGDSGKNKFAFVAMRVNKAWAHFVCSVLYRNYRISDYLQFVGFVNTISTGAKGSLPYGSYIRSIDLTSVNRYGVDTRVTRLIRHCNNLRTVSLGHPTSVKADTIALMARHCQKLQTLQLGGLESFPFMLECDFSSLRGLRTVDICSTPLTTNALHTLPMEIEHIRFARLDALQYMDVKLFLQARQKHIQSIRIEQCRFMDGPIADMIAPLKQLEKLELVGTDIGDPIFEGLADVPNLCLDTLRIVNTHITDTVLQGFLTARSRSIDRPRVRHLELADNRFVSDDMVQALLVRRHCL
ncbi:hypothetical protein BCR43DRAFT_489252 [Syncephalastrum racemosum]|uniref:F-box domain-containing protein n=1 Tax=Syncephalastrum racemosum TaxID=13706 RepID=A0A1X2HJZ9_SYNRA|nr:hypothetical protein BCR43DRAFT_489252 [Syncephalastrum racemosum]